MARLSLCGQLRLMLWRNGLLLRRDARATLLQVLLPLIIFGFLASLKSAAPPTSVPAQRLKQHFEPGAFAAAATQQPGSVLLYAPRGNTTQTGGGGGGGSYVERVMDRLRDELDRSAADSGGGSGARPSDSLIVGLGSAADVQRYWERSYSAAQPAAANAASGGQGQIRPVWAAVLFGEGSNDPSGSALGPTPAAATAALPCDVAYTLRFNGSLVPSAAADAEFARGRRASAGQLAAAGENVEGGGGAGVDGSDAFAAQVAWLQSSGGTSVASAQYIASGLLTLQRQINRAVLDVRLQEQLADAWTGPAGSGAGVAPAPRSGLRSLFSSYSLSFQSFPSPARLVDPFHGAMVDLGPAYMVLGYTPLLQKMVSSVVGEKERRVKESVLIAGLHPAVYAGSWMISFLLVAMLPVGLTTLMSEWVGFYRTTSTAVLLALLLLYVLCLILFAFAVSTLFSRAKLASQVSATMIFLIFLPQYLLPSGDEAAAGAGSPATVLGFLALLSPPIAFARGFRAIADAESLGIPLSFPGQLRGAPESAPYTMGLCLLALLLDAVLLALGALWLDAVVPGEYGMAKPWWFPCAACTRWCNGRRVQGAEEEDADLLDLARPGAGAGPNADASVTSPDGLAGAGLAFGGRQSSRYQALPLSVSSLPTSPDAPVPLASPESHAPHPSADFVPRAPIEEPVHYTPLRPGLSDADADAVAAHAVRPGIRLVDVRKTFGPRDGGGVGTVVQRCLTRLRSFLCCNSTRRVGKDPDGTVHALRGLNLQIARGEILALLGPNASGKTTTISLLSGLLAPDSAGDSSGGGGGGGGRILFEGMGGRRADGSRLPLPLTPRTLSRIREHLFVCPQSEVFFDALTVAEHLSFYATLRGVAAARVVGHYRSKLAELGLADKEHERVATLSGGQKRKLCVAMALMGVENLPANSGLGAADPGAAAGSAPLSVDSSTPPPGCLDVLFLDEPSSGVDPVSRRAIWDVIQRYRCGRVVLLTTHAMGEAEALADRIAVLHRGRLRAAGTHMWLKRRFGSGYKLVIEVDATVVRGKIARLTRLVQAYVPGAQRVQLRADSEDGEGDEDAHAAAGADGHREESKSPSHIDADAEADGDADREHDSFIPRGVGAAGSSSHAHAPAPSLELTYLLPLTSLSHFAALFHRLEREHIRRRFGIARDQGVNVSLQSLEEIFFKVIEEEEEEEEGNGGNEENSVVASSSIELSGMDESRDRDLLRARGASPSDDSALADAMDSADEEESAEGGPAEGPPPLGRVVRALLWKRWWLARKDMKALVFLLVFPALYVSFGLLFSLRGVDSSIWHGGEGRVELGFGSASFARMFGGDHAVLPVAVHYDSGSAGGGGGSGARASAWVAELLRSASPPLPASLLLSSDNAAAASDSDADLTSELDALLSHLQRGPSAAALDERSKYAYAALYLSDRDGGADVTVMPPGAPLVPGSELRMLYNNSAAHVAPLLSNALYSAMLSRMDEGSPAWAIDASTGTIVSNISVPASSSSCPRRSISASLQPFPYASSSLLLQASSVLLGILLVISLAAVHVYFGSSHLKFERNDTPSAGGGDVRGATPSSLSESNPLRACTNVAQQKLHGGADLMWRYWACNGAVDTALGFAPLLPVYALFALFGNALLLGANAPASAVTFFAWSGAMSLHTYCWTYVFARSDTLQLVLTLLYGTISLAGCLILALGMLLLEVAQRAAPGTDPSDPGSAADLLAAFDWDTIQAALATGPGVTLLVALWPSAALPWTVMHLALHNYLVLARGAACNMESGGGGGGGGGSAAGGDISPSGSSSIPCQPSSALELFAYSKLGGVILGLLASSAISALFLLWRERYLARWWRAHVSASHSDAPLVEMARAPAGGWPQPPGSVPLFLPPPVVAPVGNTVAVAAAPVGGDIEMGRLQAATSPPQSLRASVADRPAGIGIGAGSFSSQAAPSDPPDVAEECERVRAQFDAHGHPRSPSETDPIALLALRKSFPLAEPLLVPSAAPLDPAWAAADGIAGAIAPPTVIREKHAIADLHLGVRRGECFGLLGPNGAGKSSTMAVLCGSLVPDSGGAFFLGRSCVDSAASPAFAREVSHRLAFVPQTLGLFDALTPLQHALLYGRLKGLRDSVILVRARRLFAALQLTAHAHQAAEHLSGGSKRKLLLCIALLGDPAILLLDEPSTGVDVASRKAMWTLLQRTGLSADVAGTGMSNGNSSGGGSEPRSSRSSRPSRSCILTTHSLEEAEALSSRLGIMVNGSFRCVGTARALKRAHGDGLELQVKLRAPAAPAAEEELQALQAVVGAASLDPQQLRAQLIPVITRLVCAMVDAARRPQPRTAVVEDAAGHGPAEADEPVARHSSAADADADFDSDTDPDADVGPVFDPLSLPPLHGFPFAAVPSLSSPPAPPPLGAFASARLLSHYNGLLTFALPTPPDAQSSVATAEAGARASSNSSSSFSLSLFFAYMQLYRRAYLIDDFALQQCTLDRVFLKFARQQVDADA